MYKHSNFNNLNKLINCHSTDFLITQKNPKQNTNLKCYSKVEPLLGLNLCQNLLRKFKSDLLISKYWYAFIDNTNTQKHFL